MDNNVIGALITGISSITIALITTWKKQSPAPSIHDDVRSSEEKKDVLREHKKAFNLKKTSMYIVAACLLVISVAVFPFKKLYHENLFADSNDGKPKVDSLLINNNIITKGTDSIKIKLAILQKWKDSTAIANETKRKEDSINHVESEAKRAIFLAAQKAKAKDEKEKLSAKLEKEREDSIKEKANQEAQAKEQEEAATEKRKKDSIEAISKSPVSISVNDIEGSWNYVWASDVSHNSFNGSVDLKYEATRGTEVWFKGTMNTYENKRSETITVILFTNNHLKLFRQNTYPNVSQMCDLTYTLNNIFGTFYNYESGIKPSSNNIGNIDGSFIDHGRFQLIRFKQTQPAIKKSAHIQATKKPV